MWRVKEVLKLKDFFSFRNHKQSREKEWGEMPNLRSIQCWLQAVWIWKLTFTRSYFSDVPASLVHDVFHYYLFQAIGGFISCRLMQHAASKFSRLLFIQNSRVLDDMPSCHVLSQQTCWKKRWVGLGRNGPHSTCATPTRRLYLLSSLKPL